jgi:hypothetical protein
MFKVFALVCYFSFVLKSIFCGTNNGLNRQTFENGVSTSLEMPFPSLVVKLRMVF